MVNFMFIYFFTVCDNKLYFDRDERTGMFVLFCFCMFFKILFTNFSESLELYFGGGHFLNSCSCPFTFLPSPSFLPSFLSLCKFDFCGNSIQYKENDMSLEFRFSFWGQNSSSL